MERDEQIGRENGVEEREKGRWKRERKEEMKNSRCLQMLIHGLFSLNVLMFAVCIISIRPKHDNDTKSLMIFSVLFFDIDSSFPVFYYACFVLLFRIYSFFLALFVP